PKRTLRAAKNFHRTLSEAEPAGRILRRVAPGRSRGAAGLTADACTARARCKRCGQARRYRLPGTRQQQCGKQGLTPELSRAAKRHRLERLVRPPFPGTCARSAATQPLRRTVQQAPCLVLPKRTMRAAKNSHRALPEADPAG